MNKIKELMQVDVFTSKEFNQKLNESLEYGWNGTVTLNFLYVAECLGMIKCLGQIRGKQYTWEIIEEVS